MANKLGLTACLGAFMLLLLQAIRAPQYPAVPCMQGSGYYSPECNVSAKVQYGRAHGRMFTMKEGDRTEDNLCFPEQDWRQ